MLRFMIRLAAVATLLSVITLFSVRVMALTFGRSVLIWEHQYLTGAPTTVLWDDGRVFRFPESLHMRNFRWTHTGDWAWIANFNGESTVHVWDSWHILTVSAPRSFNTNLESGDALLRWESRTAGTSTRLATWDGSRTHISDTAPPPSRAPSAAHAVSQDGREAWVTLIAREVQAILVSEHGSTGMIYGDFGLIRWVGWSR